MAMKKFVKFGGAVLALLLVVVWLASKGQKAVPPAGTGVQKEAPAAKAEKKRKIKYWVAPMDPTYIRNKPGKSPMGMDLVPVYEDEEASAEGVVSIDPVTVQNIGVRTTQVIKGSLTAEVRTVGHVTYDEEMVQHVHTKVQGWVEELFVNTTGQEVRKGEKLLTIYSPDLVATQEEYLQALRYARQTEKSKFKDIAGGGKALVEATRTRLLLMDIQPAQIQALEKRGQVQKTTVLHSPATGVVIDKRVLAGMEVNPGMDLYTIADLSRVWILASVYEYELPFVKNGQEAEITLPYEPGAVYEGRVSFVYPYLSAATRTIQVRIEFRNPRLLLKPDMYVNVTIKSKVAGDVLQIPSDAVIRTGTRNIVITALGEGKFLPKEVALGPQGQGMVQIRSGLVEGETVVTSGQFLIDSESNLRQAVTRMEEVPSSGAPGGTHAKVGTPAAKPAAAAGKTAEAPPALDVHPDTEQKVIISAITDTYLKIHDALIADAVEGVTSNAKTLSDLVYKLQLSDPRGELDELTAPMTKSMEGLLSGDLTKERDALASMSEALAAYIKGPGRAEALAAGIKIFHCPMRKAPWLQKGAAVQNPYLGKDMILCGTEIKY
jgi:Cu(I)/Ag(I) efflux system membrane fusion protein